MKTRILLPTLCCACALLAGAEAWAATTNVSISSRATIRNGTLVDANIDETGLGYVMVKYHAGGSVAKGYFEFDLAGQNPDTQSAATFTVRRTSSSGAQHVKLWALNEAYPGMADSITWNTAQANDTANNNLLETGPLTATPLTDRLVAGGVGNVDFTISPPWGQFVHGNRIVLILTGVEDAGNADAGFRVTLTNAPLTPRLTFNDASGNLAPRISPATDQTLYAHHTSLPLPFTVNDDTTSGKSIRHAPRSSPSLKPVAASCGYSRWITGTFSGAMSLPGTPWHFRHSSWLRTMGAKNVAVPAVRFVTTGAGGLVGVTASASLDCCKTPSSTASALALGFRALCETRLRVTPCLAARPDVRGEAASAQNGNALLTPPS